MTHGGNAASSSEIVSFIYSNWMTRRVEHGWISIKFQWIALHAHHRLSAQSTRTSGTIVQCANTRRRSLHYGSNW